MVDTPSGEPYGDVCVHLQQMVQGVDILVGFNIKYDLHWLRRYGVLLPKGYRIWDCQLADFLLNNQLNRYPALNDALARYNLPRKLDVVKTEYWDKDIDTNEVPPNILLEYMEHDIRSTYSLALHQFDEIQRRGLRRLMDLCCQDLIVLEEMEWNGLKMNVGYSLEQANIHREKQREYASKLGDIIPHPINWSSPKQVSAVLYGGKIDYADKEQVGFFKTGARKGQSKYKKVVRTEEYDSLVQPLDGSETATEGIFSTDESTLKQLRAKGKAKEIIETYLSYKSIDKLVGTYYGGLPEKLVEYQWEDDIIHHSLNQCVARTGRLSSSNPNLQNIDRTTKGIFVSRYKEKE
jgi:DNA polymerase I-like protein with 3'-5' exonuclease and polymerase domains